MQRVGLITGRVAEAMGLPVQQVMLLEQAAPLHDVGKIGVRETIVGCGG